MAKKNAVKRYWLMPKQESRDGTRHNEKNV